MSVTSGERALHAYHDGELRGFARWRFERRLARSPELRRELEALALMRELVREGESQLPTSSMSFSARRSARSRSRIPACTVTVSGVIRITRFIPVMSSNVPA